MSTFGCDVLNFEAMILLSNRSFPTWQLRHSPPVGNSRQVKNHRSTRLARDCKRISNNFNNFFTAKPTRWAYQANLTQISTGYSLYVKCRLGLILLSICYRTELSLFPLNLVVSVGSRTHI